MTLISYEHVSVHESGELLVDLSRYPFVLGSAYFHAGLSTDSHMYARRQVVDKLVRIQEKLRPLRFKIWDAWRPRSVQVNIYKKFWDELKREHPDWNEEQLKREVGIFVTDPNSSKKIPPHSTGGALDLTLVDSEGAELNMGTVFDYFGPEANAMYFEQEGRDETVRKNRRMLREAMETEDFRFDNDEWWHFDFGNQLWAFAKGKPFAPYGEKASPSSP